MIRASLVKRSRRLLRGLRRHTGGAVIIEFAFAFPVVLAMGMYGLNAANLAITHLKLNQIALNLADNASRVGASSNLSKQQMRVVDVEDIFLAAQNHGAGLDLVNNGRVILSSLEKDAAGVQRLHWQRCFGAKTEDEYQSHFGKVKDTDGDTETDSNNNGVIETSELRNEGVAMINGMGTDRVNAPTIDSGVMFVEINYRHTPMFTWLMSASDLQFTASFIVRDKRDFSQLYGAKTSTSYECGYTTRNSGPSI